jgi:hypothetical protein
MGRSLRLGGPPRGRDQATVSASRTAAVSRPKDPPMMADEPER